MVCGTEEVDRRLQVEGHARAKDWRAAEERSEAHASEVRLAQVEKQHAGEVRHALPIRHPLWEVAVGP